MHSAVYAIVRCLSVTLRYCIDTAERLELVFETEATIPHCFVVRLSPRNKITSLWHYVPKSELRFFPFFSSRHCGIDLFSCLAASVF